MTDDVRAFLERVLGWVDPRPVDRAIRLMERSALHHTPLVFCGEYDRDVVRIARAVHRRAFGEASPFVVADPHRSLRNAGLVRRPTLAAALEVARDGVLCVRSRHPPRDFARVLSQVPNVGARVVVCADVHERCDVLLAVAEPIRVPSLASRREELPRIVDAYADDARAELGSSAPFTASYRHWVTRHCVTLPAIEVATRRMVALQRAGNVAGAAALLGMGHTSLGEWLARRRGLAVRLKLARGRALGELSIAAPPRYPGPEFMDEAGNEALRDAIRHMHGCESTWVESVPVQETFNGQTVWEGDVEVFDLIDHPQATRCYAWSSSTNTPGRRRFHAVLGVGPITDAVMAVRASIIADTKPRAP